MCSCKNNNHSLNAGELDTSKFQKSFVYFWWRDKSPKIKKNKFMIKDTLLIERRFLKHLKANSFFNLGDIPQTPNSYFQMLKNQKNITTRFSILAIFVFSKKKIFEQIFLLSALKQNAFFSHQKTEMF